MADQDLTKDKDENKMPDKQEDLALRDETEKAEQAEQGAGAEEKPAADALVSDDTDAARQLNEPVEKPKDEEVI